MSRKQEVAYYIWQARDEACMDGSEEHDWWLAERFLDSNLDKDKPINYDDVYIWVMTNA